MQHLLLKRQQIESFKEKIGGSAAQAKQLGQSILSSWKRSTLAAIPKDRSAAPIIDQSISKGTALEHALKSCYSFILGKKYKLFLIFSHTPLFSGFFRQKTDNSPPAFLIIS